MINLKIIFAIPFAYLLAFIARDLFPVGAYWDYRFLIMAGIGLWALMLSNSLVEGLKELIKECNKVKS